jgi:glycosyltransferase involved in cell wall biosynthesis
MVKILGFSYDTGLLLPEDPANESQYRQTQYCDLLDQQKTIVVMSREVPYRERLLACNRIRAVGVSARSSWLQVWRAWATGVRVATGFQPDIVEYQDPRLAGVAAYWVAKTLHAPLVGGVFNDFLDNPTWIKGSASHRLYNAAGKFVLSRTLHVRCDSVETTRALNEKGFAQVQHIPFYVPWLERFTAADGVQAERLRRWDEDPIVLCVARLSAEKNVALLLQAFGQAYAACRRGRLLIVGDGPLRDGLERLAAQLEISPHVSWIGSVDYVALPRFYREANIFALSSNSETSARALILAQASRVPTLTTDTSGSHDIVREGSTGYITPVGDVAGFAKRLRELLSERSIYERFLLTDEYYASEQHGQPVITTHLKAFYGDVMRSARAGHNSS